MTRTTRLFAALLVLAFSTSSEAQNCAPGTLCSPGSSCPDVVCGAGGGSLHVQTFSASTPPQAPPVANLIVQLPRFEAPPGAVLLRAQVDFSAETVDAAIRSRNLTPNTLFNEQFTLLAAAQVQGPIPPLLAPGLILPTCAVSYSDNLGPTTWPGPPALPCEFGGPDSISHTGIDNANGRRVCIDDPQLLAGQFLASGAATTVDFRWDLLDSFQQTGATGSTCTEFSDAMRVSVSITYFFCASGAGPGTAICGGGALAPACPCNNLLAPGRGCPNSAGPGARLGASGNTAPDTVQLLSSGEPAGALSLVLQGTLVVAPATFGDGLRCIAGDVRRLYVQLASGGVVSAPGPGELAVRARATQLGDAIGPGSVRHYAVWYRDPDPAFCPAPLGSTFNVTNGYSIVWP